MNKSILLSVLCFTVGLPACSETPTLPDEPAIPLAVKPGCSQPADYSPADINTMSDAEAQEALAAREKWIQDCAVR